MAENTGDGQAGDDVPDAPPGGDDEHAAVGREVREQGRAQQEHEAQSGVLDARFDGEGLPVLLRDLEGRPHTVTDAERQEVMDQDHHEDILDALEEGVHVAGEGEDDHRDEEDEGNPLQGLLEGVRDLGQEPGGEDAQGERNAQQDEDGLEHVPQRDDQGGNLVRDRGEMQVGVAPEPEIERGHQDGEGRGDGGQAHGKLDIAPRKGGHEIGDIAARAGGHEDHAEAHHGRDPPAQEDGQQAGEGRQQDQLAQRAQDDGFRFAEHIDEGAGLDAQGDSEHDEREDDVDCVHSTGIQGYLDLVDSRSGFRRHLVIGFCIAAKVSIFSRSCKTAGKYQLLGIDKGLELPYLCTQLQAKVVKSL